MTSFQLTRTGFVLLGTYFVLTGLVSPLVSAVGTELAFRDSELGGDIGWGHLAYALPILLVMAAPGVALIWASRLLAGRLWPGAEDEAPSSFSAEDAACLGIALLGLYFAIGGLTIFLGFGATALMFGEGLLANKLVASGVPGLLIGVLLFFQAHRLARFLTHRA